MTAEPTLREKVAQARADWYEVALGHGEKTGHELQEQEAYGRVRAFDIVLDMIDGTAPEVSPSASEGLWEKITSGGRVIYWRRYVRGGYLTAQHGASGWGWKHYSGKLRSPALGNLVLAESSEPVMNGRLAMEAADRHVNSTVEIS